MAKDLGNISLMDKNMKVALLLGNPANMATGRYIPQSNEASQFFGFPPFQSLVEEFVKQDIAAIKMLYKDEDATEVENSISSSFQAVLVFVNPVEKGVTRKTLDEMLRRLSQRGVLVSSHPDVILKLGTKEVLYHTRHTAFGSDVKMYETVEQMRVSLCNLLMHGARVIKPNRSQSGDGIWKVEYEGGQGDNMKVTATLATSSDREICVPIRQFCEMIESYLVDKDMPRGNVIIDQPYSPHLKKGMLRCYVAGNRVCGFGHQYVTQLLKPHSKAPPRYYYASSDTSRPEFAFVRRRMETEWIAELQKLLGISTAELPVLWDVDFLYGSADDSFILCEINISSVFPYPEVGNKDIVDTLRERLHHAANL